MFCYKKLVRSILLKVQRHLVLLGYESIQYGQYESLAGREMHVEEQATAERMDNVEQLS